MNSRGIHHLSAPLPYILLCSLLLAGNGCELMMRETRGQKKIGEGGNVAVTLDQVRLRMRAHVEPMCGQIEHTADAIIAGTTNPIVQRAALRWKIEGVPAVREALFQPEPLTAVFDTWVLCFQMKDYFETGGGKESLGAASTQAVATCQHMEEEITEIAISGSITGDVSKVRALAERWATEHPVGHSIGSRESALSRVLEREVAASFSFGGAVSEMTSTVDDLNRRLEIYSAQLFRQARWEVELLKSELMADLSSTEPIPSAVGFMKSVDQLAQNLNSMAPAVEQTLVDAPNLITAERTAALNAMQEELSRTLRFLREERTAALEHLTAERIAAMELFEKDLTLERKALAQELNQMSVKIVDYTALRAAQIIAATVSVQILAVVALLFLVRRMFFQRNRNDV